MWLPLIKFLTPFLAILSTCRKHKASAPDGKKDAALFGEETDGDNKQCRGPLGDALDKLDKTAGVNSRGLAGHPKKK